MEKLLVMKKNTELFLSEFKTIYKQCISFIIIAGLIFTLSISLFCFSLDIITGYKDFLDENSPDGIYVKIYPDTIDDFFKYDIYGDYSSIVAQNVTFLSSLKFGENIVSSINPPLGQGYLMGNSYIFKDNLPQEYMNAELTSGRWWEVSDNEKIDGKYNIFISQETSDMLSCNTGDIINLCIQENISDSYSFTVVGIYIKEELGDDFVIPVNFIKDVEDKLTWWVSYFLAINKTSDILDLYPKLQRAGLEPSGFPYITLDEVGLVNSTRYILIAISIVTVLIACFILNNIITIIVNSRQDFIARLKLLGAKSLGVSVLYYSFLALSFLISFMFASALSFAFKNYYSKVANSILDFPINMQLHPIVFLVLFLSGILILGVRFLLLKKRISKIQPIDAIRKE